MGNNKYVIGVDFGTDSCRAVVVQVDNGKEIATDVQYYPRWKKGFYCNPQLNQYRQHPLDYIESLENALINALSNAPAGMADDIIGISFDMTGSTPVLTDKNGIPLALLDQFADNPNAMFMLWKDHTAKHEADEINKLAHQWEIDYTSYEGGIYSSEWVWSKVLHVLREDASIRDHAYSWIEHTDWIPALLTGNLQPEKAIRNRCAAGHKAMWHASWGGLPSEKFLTTLSPLLAGFRSHLYRETFPTDKKVGNLTKEWAVRLGLNTDVAIGLGAIDCHVGAVGAGIQPGTFVRVMGTSTCDVMVVPPEEMGNKQIPGICGQVDGSVLPGLIGLEAGQSAFGDVYNWFKKILEWPLENILTASTWLTKAQKEQLKMDISPKILTALAMEAAHIPIADSTLIATDWLNGRRTPNADLAKTATITGITLGSTAPMLFRALVEATAYGSKAIIDRFSENGITINDVVAIGGISHKSPFVMQILADVLGVPIKVAASEQTCALGAAMFASVVSGYYPDIVTAQKKMGKGFSTVYWPDAGNAQYYQENYKRYLDIGA